MTKRGFEMKKLSLKERKLIFEYLDKVRLDTLNTKKEIVDNFPEGKKDYHLNAKELNINWLNSRLQLFEGMMDEMTMNKKTTYFHLPTEKIAGIINKSMIKILGKK